MKTALMLFVVVGGLAGCGHDAAPSAPVDIRPVRAEQVGRSAEHSTTRYAGEVRARYETDLAFRVPGRVQSRKVDVGATVKAGQVIATLDAHDFALATNAAGAQLAAAESQARLARQDLQRYSELRAQNFISQAELDRRQATADAAQAQVRQMRAETTRQGNQQTYTQLTAPQAGVITAIAFEVGQVVAAGQPVATMARTGEVEVRIDVPENALDALHAAQALSIRLWSAPEVSYAGSLRELSPMADAATRTYRARIRFLKPNSAVKLGMTATVEVGNPMSTGVSVAQTALFRVNGQPEVWVVDRQTQKVASRKLQLGALIGDRAEVVSGLTPGEWVVTAGVHKLAPGQQVRLVLPSLP